MLVNVSLLVSANFVVDQRRRRGARGRFSWCSRADDSGRLSRARRPATGCL